MITVSLVLAWWLDIPPHLMLPLVVAGLVLGFEGAMTTHTYQAATRYERWLQVQAKTPQPKPQAITQPAVPRNVKAMIWDWANGAPTTRRYAEQKHEVTQGQWQSAVNWAVRHKLGELVPGEGGNSKLQWTATINEALGLLDGLVPLA